MYSTPSVPLTWVSGANSEQRRRVGGELRSLYLFWLRLVAFKDHRLAIFEVETVRAM